MIIYIFLILMIYSLIMTLILHIINLSPLCKPVLNSFPFTRLSRARAKDKAWITTALRKSSKIKSKLYKKWL